MTIRKKQTVEPELKVVSGKLMRAYREEGARLAFPSGNVYRVRMPYVADLLKRGNLPNPLITFIADTFFAGGSEDKYNAYLRQDGSQEAVQTVTDSLRAICEAVFIDPKVVDDPQADDEVAIADVPLVDQMWAFRLVFVPVQEVYPFRQQSADDVERVSRPENVSQTA